MKISDRGLALIRDFEGFSPKPYLCPANVWTIGYGHVITHKDNFTEITESQAVELLKKDVVAAEKAVNTFITVPLTQNQFDALTSFTYNLGSGALQRSTLRVVINNKQYTHVPAELKRWTFANGRKLAGLIRRRQAEADLFMSR